MGKNNLGIWGIDHADCPLESGILTNRYTGVHLIG